MACLKILNQFELKNLNQFTKIQTKEKIWTTTYPGIYENSSYLKYFGIYCIFLLEIKPDKLDCQVSR